MSGEGETPGETLGNKYLNQEKLVKSGNWGSKRLLHNNEDMHEVIVNQARSVLNRRYEEIYKY